MNRRRTLTQRDFIEAAMAFVDTHGLSELTMRALGELLDVDPTACYRHFRTKDALVAAMVDTMLAEVLDSLHDDASPRAALEAQLLACRRAFHVHPQLAAALTMSDGAMPSANLLSRRAIGLLERMGLEGDRLVEAYQVVESYTMGSSMFDMAAAPHHSLIRRERYRTLDSPAFDAVSTTPERVSDVSEMAFAVGMAAILDRLEASA